MNLLERISPRQKARAALSVLELTTDERFVVDEWINSVMGSPIVGLVFNVDFRTAEELLEHFFSADVEIEAAADFLGPIGSRLEDKGTREKLAKVCVHLLSNLPQNHQELALSVIKKISSLSFSEFQRDFVDVNEFLQEGLFVYLANTAKTHKPESKVVHTYCPHCLESLDD